MYIGAHVSVSAGYARTVAYAREVGAECMQVFAKSPRQWKSKSLDPVKAAEFVSMRREADFGPLFTHTAYLINLSTDDQELRQRSIVALADEIDRGRLLGAAGVVTHVGNDPSGDSRAAAERAAASVSDALALCEQPAGPCRLLLENTAGAGRSFGSSFTEMGWVLDALDPEYETLVGVCLDTCHAHAFGMDLSDATAWASVVADISATCGENALGLIHANDCKFDRGEKKDRHEWIGDGFIGSEAFSAMICTPELQSVSVVTEMPGEVPMKDSENIARLKNLRRLCG